ncbi:activator-dependent family glycosyltransferase [Streptomyces sp. NPDC020875]|uniref:activator-dependent family glycosyltransferase n=1 Tax=Streptomyces sp. NPDC020875 TaxID=3154898 RepID=UPI0033C3D65E
MRVLLTSLPVTSHVLNAVPLAWALRTAGHEVRLAVRPDAVPTVRGAGLPAVPVGGPLRLDRFMEQEAVLAGLGHDISQDPALLDPEAVLGILTWYVTVFLQYATDDETLDDVVALARDWRPDLVIWDALSYAGPVAAAVSGAAHVRLLFGLDLLARARAHALDDQRRLPAEARDDVLGEWLEAVLHRYGRSFTESDVFGEYTLDPIPPALSLPTARPVIPMRAVPFNGPARVPDWLARPAPGGRPRVCLTLGLSLREFWSENGVSVRDLLDAVAEVDAEVVTTLTDDDLGDGPPLPPNVRTVDFVPLTELLPTCAAIVHHGGAGTLHSAVAHGVPQLIVPDAVWDPGLLAEGVERAGAGIALPPEKLTPELLRTELTRLLADPAFRAGAAGLRSDALSRPGPQGVVRVLEGIVRAPRPPRPAFRPEP